MFTVGRYAVQSVRTIQILYFLLYAALAAWSSYFYVFLETDRHLTGVQIGIIAAVQQINNMFFLPLWGMISDRYGKRKIFLLLLGISALLLYGFLLHGGVVFYLLFIIIFSILHNPISSLIDSFAIKKSREKIVNTNYGKMRLWASAGWAFSSIFTGFVVRYTSLATIFPIASTFLIATWCIAFFNLNKKRDIQTHTIKPGFATLLHFLTDHKRLLWFFVFLMIYYIFNSPTLTFINLYYNEIGASHFHIGIAFAVQSVCELPFMFWGQQLIKKYGSKKIILFTLCVSVIRMLLYSSTTNPIFAIAIGSLHGITLGLFFIAIVDYTHRLVPESHNSTGQTLLYTFLGLGTSIGNILNGYLKDTIGLQTAMMLNAAAVSLIIIAASIYAIRMKE